MQDNRYDQVYNEIASATPGTIVSLLEPKVFDFFDQHPHK